VRACALALFRLIGAFHDSRARYGTDSEYTQRLDPHGRGVSRCSRSSLGGALRTRLKPPDDGLCDPGATREASTSLAHHGATPAPSHQGRQPPARRFSRALRQPPRGAPIPQTGR
jgi:hypothetical protein